MTIQVCYSHNHFQAFYSFFFYSESELLGQSWYPAKQETQMHIGKEHELRSQTHWV